MCYLWVWWKNLDMPDTDWCTLPTNAYKVSGSKQEREKVVYNTWCSQAVHNLSTNQAQHCLTSVIEWEPSFSAWFDGLLRKPHFKKVNKYTKPSKPMIPGTSIKAKRAILWKVLINAWYNLAGGGPVRNTDYPVHKIASIRLGSLRSRVSASNSMWLLQTLKTKIKSLNTWPWCFTHHHFCACTVMQSVSVPRRHIKLVRVRQLTSKSVVLKRIFTVTHLNLPRQNMSMLTAPIIKDQKPWTPCLV